MSGTSLDGIDAALVSCTDDTPELLDTYFLPYSESLKAQLLLLHAPEVNELAICALMGNTLASLYASAVQHLLKNNSLRPDKICAIGSHGQTIRHCPNLGYTLQIGNSALLAELTGVTVVSDFRSRDIAAGGQGAPLVPAFHQTQFSTPQLNRAIVNVGGIANITYLPFHGEVVGFDSGPGNMLIDFWTKLNTGNSFDADGRWAASGHVDNSLLNRMLADPFFNQQPPKSTGRDLFNANWLLSFVHSTHAHPADIARTLTELTARTIQEAIDQFCPNVHEIYLCGGGAHNQLLCQAISNLVSPRKVAKTDVLGVPVDWVEAVAFAWLAKQTIENKPANLPAVTGASGYRVLGAIYPA